MRIYPLGISLCKECVTLLFLNFLFRPDLCFYFLFVSFFCFLFYFFSEIHILKKRERALQKKKKNVPGGIFVIAK